MSGDFARVAAASLRVHLGDVEKNQEEIITRMRALEAQGVRVAVFPELCITGYTLGDLLTHEPVQRAAFAAMKAIAAQTGDMAVWWGCPSTSAAVFLTARRYCRAGRCGGWCPKPIYLMATSFTKPAGS